jgi:hypothetical protein
MPTLRITPHNVFYREVVCTTTSNDLCSLRKEEYRSDLTVFALKSQIF